MAVIIPLLGAVVFLISLFAIVFPGCLLKLLKHLTITPPLRLAAAVRLVLGGLFIHTADSTRFPRVIKVIGVVIVVSGVIVLLIGNKFIQRRLDTVRKLGVAVIRAGGLSGLFFGWFLLYATE